MAGLDGPCAVFEFRHTTGEMTKDNIIESLKGIAKKYVFQKEEGDSGYVHYGGRISIIKKRKSMSY